MSSSSKLSVPDDVDGGRVLPSFIPIRDVSRESDKPESSASGSRHSARSSMQDNSPRAQDFTASHDVREDSNLRRENGTVRRRPHSGGFLLDTALHPRRAFLSRSKKDKPDIKGKRPSEESEIILPKRRSRDVKHEKSSSMGGSPLATEIKRDTDTETNHNDENLIFGTDVRKSTFLQGGSTTSPRYDSGLGQSRILQNVGYDTDPAQIVNMALSLNEKRRRQVSGTRMVSGQSAGSRARPGTMSSQAERGALYTTPARSSPRFSPQVPEQDGEKARATSGEEDPAGSATANVDEENGETKPSLCISHATELRVQKAKTYFELAHEHRRLLSHLPPIRRPGGSLHQGHSKIYNPIQYSRNRKLRFSEKHPIAAEAEGWHDIDQVRAWVNTVIDAHTDTRHDPDECVRLPDLAYNKAPDSDEEDDEEDPMLLDSPSSSAQKVNAHKNAKPRRPRSDWVTHPGDMVADAHWLEQGQNKLKIVDRDGNKIYPPDTRFIFSGWRNRTPIHVPERLQEPTPPPEQRQEDEEALVLVPPVSALPELPTFTSTHKDDGRKRSHRKNRFKGKLGTRDHKDSYLDGGSSGFSSSTDYSDDEGSVRGRKLTSRKRQKPQNGGIEQRLKFKSGTDSQLSRNYTSSAEHSLDQSANSSKRPSVDNTKLSKLFTRDSKTDSSKNASKTRSGSSRRESMNDPAARDTYYASAPRNSAEYDTTAPSSPIVVGFPSIAINLSPPVSRSPSPSKKNRTSILNPFRDRSQSKISEGIDANDFGRAVSKEKSRQSSNGVDPAQESSDHASRGTSPMTRGTSPMTKTVSKATTYREPQISADDHRGSTFSRHSTKSTNTDGHSKVRGVFKGGRIAQLVGNEVSKVGDYIWKRDVPSSVRRRDSTSSSIYSDHASDTDIEQYPNDFPYRTPPQHEKRFPSNETEAQRSKRLSPNDSVSSPDSGEKVDPRYHNPNLPSFTSPFQKDRDNQEQKKRNALTPSQSPDDSKDDHDHISHLAAEHRNATKSPRLDRLAPPKLNMTRSASPTAPLWTGPFDRRSSYSFTEDGRDFSKSRNASQVFNDALKTNGIMVTGLAGINPGKSRSQSRVDLFRTLSHQSGVSSGAAEVKDVSKRDIGFTSALLYSSAIKARMMAFRAEEVRDHIPAFLLHSAGPDEMAPRNVKRKEEHLVAARNLIGRLEQDRMRFQAKLQAFQSQLAPRLHTSLQELEDLVDNVLTPRVRKSGDEAGELSMKLSTTSTLAVKDVNERIDMAIRRRRRGPVRWLRRFGYLAIEWVVVALLWGIWFIVSMLRIVRAVVVAVVRVIRWLLFL